MPADQIRNRTCPSPKFYPLRNCRSGTECVAVAPLLHPALNGKILT
jgi:hypothetical protein